MPQPYAHKPRSCVGCQTPIALPRHTRTKRCPPCQKIYGRSRNVSQGALRYVKLKADGRWPMCSTEGCDNETKTARGKHCAAHAERLAQGPGHDGTNPKAGALSRRVFDRGVRAATPRTGLVLASLAAMAPPRRPR